MAIDLVTRLRARKEARFHVQAALEKIPNNLSTPGQIRMYGQVTRVFRTDGTLRLGDKVSFGLYVFQSNEVTPPGPAYVSFDRLACATHIEAYLNGNPPSCDIPCDEYTLLLAPREQPCMTLAELEKLIQGRTLVTPDNVRKRSWRFWRK